MTLDEIREFIKLASETGVAELEVQKGESRVRIRLGVPAAVHGRASIPQAVTVHASAPAAAEQAPAAPASPRAGEKAFTAAPGAPSDGTVLVKSPIVGTFYESSAPGSAPFVRVGETVQPGKVLCIIESMKLMNEIEAEIAGVIEARLVPSGQPVEYGEALFVIRPL
jgi:acetyl-CoA carboxylase biotin carboxyl carrier protein